MTLPLERRLRWPPPRYPLGAFPSPLESCPDLASGLGLDLLLLKRDDQNGTDFGGNKLRALEWLLPAAAPTIVTLGAFGSTWCAALARAAGPLGRRAEVALFPQPWTPAVAGALSATLGGAGVHLASRRWRLPLAVTRAWKAARDRGRVSWIPAGGATSLGALGSVNALLECADQLEGLGADPPEAIVVPYGSGGTAAGLLVGAWLLDWSTRIVAVRVTDPWFTTRRRIRVLAERTRALLLAAGAECPPPRATLVLDPAQLGAGYGHETPGTAWARAAVRERGLELDPTYSAKAVAALQSLATSFRRVCFWHTFDARLVASSSDHPVLEEAHRYAEQLWPRLKSTSPSIPTNVMPTDI